MPDTETTETREVRDLSDAELRDVERQGVATVRDVNARRRAGTATSADYLDGTEAARDAVAARDELGRRIAERGEQGIVERLSRRTAPLARAREYDPELLDGVTLRAANLSDDELTELRSLLKSRQAHDRRGEAWPDAERERVEALVSKAAGEPELYARRRDEVRRADEVRAEATKLARLFLPVRRDPEPGSAELPAFLLDWLTNGEAESFDLTDLGLLSALLLSFANESGAVFSRGAFVHDERGPSIVVTQAGAGPRLVYGADDAGHVRLVTHLGALKRNGWVETAQHRGTLTIRPGERMRKLWPS